MLLSRRLGGRDLASWAAWLTAIATLTAAMVTVRASLDRAHVALAYLLLVLWVSARGGQTPGLLMAILGFLSFNFFFLPPYHTLVVHAVLDWMVLFVYLAVAMVAARLLAQAKAEAEEARRRAAEINRLSTLGAETLNAGRAEEALRAIAEVIRGALEVDRCDIYLYREGPEPSLGASTGTGTDSAAPMPASIGLVLDRNTAVLERLDGTTRLLPTGGEPLTDGIPHLDQTRALALPLRVRDRVVGALRISSGDAIELTPAQRRFFAALSYYAALGAERVRLISEEERAQALQEADRLKDALLASVSHDLRTPLTTIKALAHEILVTGDERAATIEEEADRLNRLVVDLLDLSRLNAGELRVAPELVAADDLVGAALQRVSPSLRGRELIAGLDPGEPLLVGRLDFVQSLRVLVNLLENAHKYSPPDRPIELEAARVGHLLVFRVLDRGSGIPPADAERVFEPFRQAGNGQSDVGGAGLGLSIARRLAEAQGGRLWYDPRPGGGSIFSFSVPAVDVEAGSLE